MKNWWSLIIGVGVTCVAMVAINVALGQSESNKSPDQSNTGQDRTYRSDEVTKDAVILSKPEAEYTPTARKNRISGTVVLLAVFRASGQVTNIRPLVRLPDGLTEQAMAAARKIKFTPAEKDDRPVSVRTRLEYQFSP
jgi:TonB family protein